MRALSSKRNFFVSALISITVTSTVVLGYGYWHASTHASFHVSLRLLTAADDAPQGMPNAPITFLDQSGEILAHGVSDEYSNYAHLLHPEVGDCQEAAPKTTATSTGRTAWQECFAKLATWIPKWADKVHMVNITYQGQSFNKVPVKVSRYNSEWLLWWVPLPHVGGKPYSDYRTTIIVDTRDQPLNTE